MRTLNALLIVALTLVLVAPSIALAAKKKASSGKDTPSESISLNYTKTAFARHSTTGPTPRPATH
jgi:hypothetical protein